MSSPRLQIGRYSSVGSYYVLTTITAERRRLFADPGSAAVLIDTLRFVETTGRSRSFAWVVMPDHLHWLLQLRSGTLSGLMGVLKSRSGRLLGRIPGVLKPVWQSDYFDHGIRDELCMQKQARYLLENPLRAGLADQVGEYPFAWCRWPGV